MPLDVVAGPGCDAVGKDAYVEAHRRPGDIVISVGKIYEGLGGAGVPSTNSATLRMALYLRAVAIKQAREKQLDGFILTSNGTRAELSRLQAGGGGSIRVLKMTEAQACARLAQIVPPGERREACELGIRQRWFGRFQPDPGDIEVDP